MRSHIVDTGTALHKVLRLFYERNSVCQLELARELGITKAACNLHILRLKETGIIEEEKIQPSTGRGRPSQFWKISPVGNYFLGIYLYYCEMAATVIDFGGNVVFHVRRDLSSDICLEDLTALLLSVAGECCAWIEARDGILHQCFFGAGGEVSRDGVFEFLVNAPNVTGFAPERILQEHLQIPCYADTLHYAYVQKECKSFPVDSTVLMLNWGNNLGGVVVNNFEIMTFANNLSRRNRGLWNLGHIVVEKNGKPCYCGQNGCLEQYVGGYSLAGQHSKVRNGDLADFLSLLRRGDEEATALLNDAARRMASSFYWLIELFGVDRIHFIGSFASFKDVFKESFRQGLRELLSDDDADSIEISASQTTEMDLGIGSALMARHYFFYPQLPLSCRGVYRKKNNLKHSDLF